MTYAESGSGSVGSGYGRLGGRTASVETAELTHEDVRGQLTEFLADELDEAQTTRVANHLAQCAACRAYRDTLGATVTILNALPTKGVPHRLRQRLLAIPDEEQAPPP